ncbi:CcdB family protein [Rhizobium deserti]|uniref:CcdB family protein n=1 Tax=Rhizobium deserti TaxID=2547961 RepID=UPI00247977AE|nr:CcdB family protein [Rhizobium deserti]
MGRLNPSFEIEAVSYVMATQRLASVDTKQLGAFVADLSVHADEIIAASDSL